MADLTVRQAGPEDVDAVVRLADLFYREEGFGTPVDQLRDHAMNLIASEAACVLLAVIDVEPVGFGITTTSYGLEHGSIAELEDLYVLPKARRGGVARTLIDRSWTWAEERGCNELEIVVDAEGDARHGLVAFYSKLGFVDLGRRLLTRSSS